jgi:hypothetical protein
MMFAFLVVQSVLCCQMSWAVFLAVSVVFFFILPEPTAVERDMSLVVAWKQKVRMRHSSDMHYLRNWEPLLRNRSCTFDVRHFCTVFAGSRIGCTAPNQKNDRCIR